jgi:YjjG family noncanonical pyrimidine nucleotidase
VTFRAFLFDADNTLFDFDRAEDEALSETLEVGCRSEGDEAPTDSVDVTTLKSAFSDINSQLWTALQEGTISPQFLRVERFRRLAERFALSCDAAQLADHYVRALSTRAYMLPGAVPLLDALSRRATLGLLTNGLAAVQRPRIARAELDVFFAGIFISEEIGAQKPERAAFHAALRGLHVSAEEVLYVGDDPVSDMTGARAAGLTTCWYNPSSRLYPNSEEKPDFVVARLDELLRFCPEPS